MNVVLQHEPQVPVTPKLVGVSVHDLSPIQADFLKLVLGYLSVPDVELCKFAANLYCLLPGNGDLTRHLRMETVFIKRAS